MSIDRDIKKALEKHHKGTLPKEYYAPNGHLYPRTISRGTDPKKAQKRDEDRNEVEERIAREKIKNAPVVKSSERVRITKEMAKEIKQRMKRDGLL